MSAVTEEKFERLLAQVVADIKNVEEAEKLLSDLFTATERAAIVKRLAVAIFLTNGKSYGEIKRDLKVSSATIAKVQESLDTPGMKLVIEKINIDDWAGSWAKKLAGAFGKLLGTPS